MGFDDEKQHGYHAEKKREDKDGLEIYSEIHD